MRGPRFLALSFVVAFVAVGLWACFSGWVGEPNVASAHAPTLGDDPPDLKWGKNNKTGEVSSNGTTFLGRVPGGMTTTFVSVCDFTITIAGGTRKIKKIEIFDGGGSLLGEYEREPNGPKLTDVDVTLDPCIEDDTTGDERNVEIKITTDGAGDWEATIVATDAPPVGSDEGNEITCTKWVSAGMAIDVLTNIAVGNTIRFTNATSNTLTQVQIVFANLDPNSDDPLIATVVDASAEFTTVTTVSSTTTLAGGSVAPNEEFWIVVRFTAGVDGDLGASQTAIPTF